MNSSFINQVAWKTWNLLSERNGLVYPDGTAFYVKPMEDRVLVAFDPDEIKLPVVNDKFAHDLSSRLQGRLVLRTNSRGVYLQVGYDVPPASKELESVLLNLNDQPGPLNVPLGVTRKSDLWISLVDMGSVLIGGSRGMGKSVEMHAWIQALLRGGEAEVWAWDGKRDVEFLRYAGKPKFRYIAMGALKQGLGELLKVAAERSRTLLSSGFTNMMDFNSANPLATMNPIALFIDEAALVPEDARDLLKQLIERERASGIFPVLGTNNPAQSQLLVKSNLVTRICFAVPSWNASHMVLGQVGAEKLPKEPGRGILEWKARLYEFQAFQVNLPAPNEDVVQRLLVDSVETEPVSEIAQLAESIRDRWSRDLSKRATAELLGKTYAGSWAAKVDKVIAFLTATTTTTNPENGMESA